MKNCITKTVFSHLQKYHGVYLLIIAVLFLVLWFPNRSIDRYAISTGDGGCITIIDTTTGHVWAKYGSTVFDFGTPNKSMFKVMDKKPLPETVPSEDSNTRAEIPKTMTTQEFFGKEDNNN